MALRQIEFTVDLTVGGSHSSALFAEGEDLFEALREEIISAVELDVQVTIDGVTAPWTFWMDPDHWSTDWAEMQGPDFDPHAHIVGAIGDYEPKARA